MMYKKSIENNLSICKICIEVIIGSKFKSFELPRQLDCVSFCKLEMF